MNEISKPSAFIAETAREAAIQRRYREPLDVAETPWNKTIASQLNHRSVRAYLPDALPPGTLEILIAAAQSAPSSSNVQAWSVIAVDAPAQKAHLARLANNQKHIEQAPLFLVFIADLSRVERLAEERGLTREGLDYTESFLIASLDATFAAQNTVVAAESLGLGTVYIGALRTNPEEVARVLDLPPRAFAVFGLVIGKPDPAVPTDIKPRLPQEAILHRNVYSPRKEPAAFARHDRYTLDFRREQNLDATPWTQLALQRLHSIAALKGRHVLRQTLERLGFEFK
jgi:nitroreductase